MSINAENLVRDRRALHQIPEVELYLPKTRDYLKKHVNLNQAALIENEVYKDSFLVFYDLGFDEALAFRTDMDALPIAEQNTHEFVSTHPGKMHACGHDGHMSVLLEFSRQLGQIRDELGSNIVLIFQAGEESPGGADLIVNSGVLDDLKVKAVFGLHLWPSLPFGKIYTRPGPMMSKSSEITITVHGKSTHASRYREGIDAAQIGAEMLLALYEMEQGLDPQMPRLLRFGSFHAGQACNALADQAILYGTMRAFDEDDFRLIQQRISELAKTLEKKHGTTIDLHYSSGYPALKNDPDLTRGILEANEEIYLLDKPDMASEDFSYYQTRYPGVFFFLGVEQKEPLHSARFNFDESVLEKGVELFCWLARTLSNQGAL